MELRPKGILRIQLEQAGIGQDYWEVDFKNFQGPENALKAGHRYLQKLDEMKAKGVGLLLVGPNGPGKTTIAMIVMKYLVRARWTVYTTSLGEIIERIQTSWKQQGEAGVEGGEFLESCRRADFLLIDDVGKEHRGQSGFVQTVFDNLIRYRVQHRLPTFLTSNLTKSELERTYGESVLSLLEGKLIPVSVTGEDYRRTVLREANRQSFRS